VIQPLRTLHHRIFAALALLLPAVLLAGIAAQPHRTRLSAHAPELPATAYLVRESNGLWVQHSIDSKFYGRSDRPQDIYLVLQPGQDLNEPDLLLYWVTNAPEGNVLPADAQLVGAFAMSKAFLLPLEKKRAGFLILFSLAHQAVFDTARVETLP